jgi:hypothetical protein
MKYVCQSFNGRDARATAGPLARIIRTSILEEISILSTLCSIRFSVYPGLFRAVIFLRGSGS